MTLAALRDVGRRLRARFDRLGRAIVPGTELGQPVQIERLICPLRYDLCVRIEFIFLLRAEWSLYETDLDAFLNRPQSRAYFLWFREIACARFSPSTYRDPAAVRHRFLTRVHETARLWDSIARRGLDLTRPIRLASGRSIRNVNGKMVAARVFAGDGCHRLACLFVAGQTRLEPDQYELEVRRRYQPLDNTAMLIPTLPIHREAYLRFLSRFYCDGSKCESPEQILERVAAEKPHLLTELRSVLAFDLPRI